MPQKHERPKLRSSEAQHANCILDITELYISLMCYVTTYKKNVRNGRIKVHWWRGRVAGMGCGRWGWADCAPRTRFADDYCCWGASGGGGPKRYPSLFQLKEINSFSFLKN